MELKELKEWLKKDLQAFEPIRKQAYELCQKTFNDEVYVRGLIEFSNYCRCSCHYCGLRIENQTLQRYRLSKEEIVGLIEEGYAIGYRSFVLQSGEDPYYTEEMLGDLIREAKKKKDIAITLSIGERSFRTYNYLKSCGADRFLLKHECADENIYNNLHPHSSFKERTDCLRILKELGYQTGSGFMIGLPGQTEKTIAKDLLFLKEIGVHMAGIGPFIPHEKTPLKNTEAGKVETTLKAVALTRILLPQAMLPITTSLGVLKQEMKSKCLLYGANVVMQKLQSPHLRKLYSLYPKEVIEGKTMLEEKNELEKWLESQDRKAVFTRGDHPSYQAINEK